MVTRHFNININAPREKVWETLLGKETYPKWTAVFAEGSTVETDWQKGSKAIFSDGKGSGMVARIEENIPNEHLSIIHLGEVVNGVEDTESDKVKDWAGAHENYTLKTSGNGTEVAIDMELSEQYADMFNETWPKALEKLKELSEA
jgi:hypothetical protein